MKFLLAPLLLLSTMLCAQNSELLIREVISEKASSLGLEVSDYAEFNVKSKSSSAAKGAEHFYVQQTLNGMPIANGKANFTFKNGELSVANINFVRNINSIKNADVPHISAASALENVLDQLEISHEPLRISESGSNSYVVEKADFALEDVPLNLAYFYHENSLKLVWELNVYPRGAQHWWSIKVDALNGEILWKNDWVLHCDFGSCENSGHNHDFVSNANTKSDECAGGTAKSLSQYRVFAIPTESPNHGSHELVSNPHDLSASPFGWHDTDGNVGAEYTISRGNNVYAYEDANDDDNPGYSPDGISGVFDFGYSVSQTANQNMDAAITNLFYMNNIMHDVYFQYGFDEASGNFQFLNYTGMGNDDDEVRAEAQDGSGTNNANFATPPDGYNPRMQMYLWSSSSNTQLLTINAPPSIAGSYETTYASWSEQISAPITADLWLVQDNVAPADNGCETIINASDLNGKIAVVRRGTCTFIEKAEALEIAGAVGVIIVNNVGGDPISMGGTGSVSIPVLMVSQTDGNAIIAQLNASNVVNGTLQGTGNIIANDSDIDNGVIAHEYGHGISNRLTGGGNDTDCLYNDEQMGEGWSDFFGLMLTMQPGATATQNRGVGTYLINQPITGTGIRPRPYNTSFAVNNYTYGKTNNTSLSRPHGIGFVWCTMLWDLNWALIDEYGFDEDVYNGTGGNNVALSLVVEALKIQPCAPGFVDGRDAILAADQLLYNGANTCIIWDVFAKRGLGLSADQGDSDDRADQTEAFDKPICTLSLKEIESGDITLYPNPTNDLIYLNSSFMKELKEVRLYDMQGKEILQLINNSSGAMEIDLKGIEAGSYLLKCGFGDTIITKRISKY